MNCDTASRDKYFDLERSTDLIKNPVLMSFWPNLHDSVYDWYWKFSIKWKSYKEILLDIVL